MDKTMSIINVKKEEYIEWLTIDKGMTKEEAEKMAYIMGYDDEEA